MKSPGKHLNRLKGYFCHTENDSWRGSLDCHLTLEILTAHPCLRSLRRLLINHTLVLLCTNTQSILSSSLFLQINYDNVFQLTKNTLLCTCTVCFKEGESERLPFSQIIFMKSLKFCISVVSPTGFCGFLKYFHFIRLLFHPSSESCTFSSTTHILQLITLPFHKMKI